MSKKIVLVRHCKASMEGIDEQRALDQDGKVQAKSLCEKLNKILKPDSEIFTSPFTRAVDSLMPLTEINKNVKINESKFLEEIHIAKNPELTKHQIIEKMWSDPDYSVEGGISQIKHYDLIKDDLEKLFDNFKKNNKDVIIVTHGNLLGMIIKFLFKMEFKFDDWKVMSMPDLYILSFDENNKIIDLKRDINNIEKIFQIK